MLTAILILLLNVIIAVIILEIILWVLNAIVAFAVPEKIRRLLYALIAVWFLIGVVEIISGGPALYYGPTLRRIP